MTELEGTPIVVQGPNAVTATLQYFNQADKCGLQLDVVHAWLTLQPAVFPFLVLPVMRKRVRQWLTECLPTGDDGRTAKRLTKKLAKEHPEIFQKRLRGASTVGGTEDRASGRDVPLHVQLEGNHRVGGISVP